MFGHDSVGFRYLVFADNPVRAKAELAPVERAGCVSQVTHRCNATPLELLLLFQPEYLYCGNQMDGGKVGGNSGCDNGSSRYAFNDVIVDVQNAVGTGYSCARGW